MRDALRLCNKLLLWPFVTVRNFVPALIKVKFNILRGCTLNHGVNIVPAMRHGVCGVRAQARDKLVPGRIPAVKVATEFNQRIDTTYKGVLAIDD